MASCNVSAWRTTIMICKTESKAMKRTGLCYVHRCVVFVSIWFLRLYTAYYTTYSRTVYTIALVCTAYMTAESKMKKKKEKIKEKQQKNRSKSRMHHVWDSDLAFKITMHAITNRILYLQNIETYSIHFDWILVSCILCVPLVHHRFVWWIKVKYITEHEWKKRNNCAEQNSYGCRSQWWISSSRRLFHVFPVCLRLVDIINWILEQCWYILRLAEMPHKNAGFFLLNCWYLGLVETTFLICSLSAEISFFLLTKR